MRQKTDHSVSMLVYDGVASSDVTGPLECFGLANYISGRPIYEITTFSVDGKPVKAAGGWLSLQPVHSCESLPADVELLLVPGGPAAAAMAQDATLKLWLANYHTPERRFGSICNGTFILAAAGLARGVRVATHWLYAEQLASLHPDIEVDADALFVRSGNIWSSAGMTAGMDLALAMIEEDCGRPLAMEVARHMVLYIRRGGGQSQFSIHLKAQFSDMPAIGRLQQWIVDNPAGDLSVATLAKQATMSSRTLLRLFKEQTGMTVGEFIGDSRVRHACDLLETSDRALKAIASASGFGTESNMRKVFMSRLGVSPMQYRSRFRITGPAPKHFNYDESWLHRTEFKQFAAGKRHSPQMNLATPQAKN